MKSTLWKNTRKIILSGKYPDIKKLLAAENAEYSRETKYYLPTTI